MQAGMQADSTRRGRLLSHASPCALLLRKVLLCSGWLVVASVRLVSEVLPPVACDLVVIVCEVCDWAALAVSYHKI
jgi:hypothetical protein